MSVDYLRIKYTTRFPRRCAFVIYGLTLIFNGTRSAMRRRSRKEESALSVCVVGH